MNPGSQALSQLTFPFQRGANDVYLLYSGENPSLHPASALLTEEPPVSFVLGQAPWVRAEACQVLTFHRRTAEGGL